MSKRDIGTDDPRVRVRPGKHSRPRTKNRPNYDKSVLGRVVCVHRGRFLVALMQEPYTQVLAVKARLLSKETIIVGDIVFLQGDITGRKDTLARIVLIQDRVTELRRSLEEEDKSGVEKQIVANATQMLIVVSAKNPQPRMGMIDRCLVAAKAAKVRPILCITKTDLASANNVSELYKDLGIQVFAISLNSLSGSSLTEFEKLRRALRGETTVFVGHSGVGKSTLINALVPNIERKTGEVNSVTGRGRHTSTSVLALQSEAEYDTWVIDTPGVRSFGLGHLGKEEILEGFPELYTMAQNCPRGCTHLENAPDCYLDTIKPTPVRLESLRRLLTSRTVRC